jgi:diadenosine tetraphosphate (Ap4A) HIT family hydrolase
MRDRIMDEEKDVLGFNVGINAGPVAGQTVMHSHIHLIPRRRNDVADPRGGVRGVIPGRLCY